jgi:hypothetical protein
MTAKKFIGIVVFTFLSLVLIEACTDMGSNVPMASTSPIISSIEPDSATAGDTVRVRGKNFGGTRGSNNLDFAPEIVARVFFLWTDTLIVALVPDSAATGNVFISVNGIESNGIQFKTPIHGTIISFSKTIQPILSSNCAVSGCHTGLSPSSGLNLSTYAGVRAGGNFFRTNVVIPYDSTDSDIMKMIRSSNNPLGIRMPESGKYASTGLPDSLIVQIGTWIQQGALNN